MQVGNLTSKGGKFMSGYTSEGFKSEFNSTMNDWMSSDYLT